MLHVRTLDPGSNLLRPPKRSWLNNFAGQSKASRPGRGSPKEQRTGRAVLEAPFADAMAYTHSNYAYDHFSYEEPETMRIREEYNINNALKDAKGWDAIALRSTLREQVAKSHNQHRATLYLPTSAGTAELGTYKHANQDDVLVGKGPSQELIARSAELWRKCRDALADGTIEQMAREMGIEKSPKKTEGYSNFFRTLFGPPRTAEHDAESDHAAPVPAAPAP